MNLENLEICKIIFNSAVKLSTKNSTLSILFNYLSHLALRTALHTLILWSQLSVKTSKLINLLSVITCQWMPLLLLFSTWFRCLEIIFTNQQQLNSFNTFYMALNKFIALNLSEKKNVVERKRATLDFPYVLIRLYDRYSSPMFWI